MLGKATAIFVTIGLIVAIAIGFVCSNGICRFAKNMGNNVKRNYTFAKLLISMQRLLSDDRFFVYTIDERISIGPNDKDSIDRDISEEQRHFHLHPLDHRLVSCLNDESVLSALYDKVNLSNEKESNENARFGYDTWWKHCVVVRTRASLQ